MLKILKRTRIFVILSTLFLLMLVAGVVNYHVSFEEQANMINAVDAKTVALDVKAIAEYNKGSNSVYEDYKALFEGKYSSLVNMFHRFDLITSLIIVIFPIVFILSFLLMAGVSYTSIVITVCIFAVFTFLPLMIL